LSTPGVVAIVILCCVVPWVAAIFATVRKQPEHRLCRTGTEIIDGKEFSVHTEKLPVMREKSTGRVGIALRRGYSNEPTMIDGKTAMVPEWTQIQFLRKSDGVPSRVEWRRFSKFEMIGTTDVDYLSHRVSMFRTERLMRYRVNQHHLLSSPAR
jgi:hypothetical protein